MPAARPGAAAAPKLRALAGLAAARAAGAWRIGISLSRSGGAAADFFRGDLAGGECSYCRNVKTALELWAWKAGDRGLHSNVTFDIRDDRSDYALMLRNYEAMAQDPSVHVLLGPSNGIWNDAAGAIADNGAKVMIKWAFDIPAIYDNLPWSAELYSNSSFLQGMIREELILEEAGLGSSSASSASTPPSSSSASGASPSGGVSRFSFDVNIRPQHWAEDALDTIGLDGNRFLFAWYDDLPSHSRHESQCMDYTRHVQQRGGSASVMPLHWYGGSFVELGTLAAIMPDVLCLCGPDYAIVSLLVYLKAKRIVTKYVMVGQPVGLSADLAHNAALMSYILEPIPISAPDMQRPDPVYGNTLSFLSAWFSRVGSYPGYEAFQVTGSLSLLIEALRAEDPGTFSSEALVQRLRSSRTGTVLGWLSFTEEGGRSPGADMMPSTRQLLPEPVIDGVSNLLRYQRCHAQVVSQSAKDSCRGPLCQEAIADRVAVNPVSWEAKQMEVYPCPAGCLLTAERCLPCPRGTRRRSMEIECRSCGPGEYTEYPGMRDCLPCPRGGVCRTSDQPFVAETGYCRVLPWFGDCRSTFPNHTLRADLVQLSGHGLECTEKQLHPADTTFKRCIPTRVCVGGAQPCIGSNRGMLCGQCPRGQTYFGVGSGRRMCRECPQMADLVFRHVLTGLSLIVIVAVMQRFARKTATRPSYLTAPLFRGLVHYLHLVSAVCENTRLDAHPVIAMLLLPLDVLYRPLDLAQTSCFHDIPEEERGDEAKLWLRPEITFSLGMVPLGIMFIIAIHITEQLLRWLWRCVILWIGRKIWDRFIKAYEAAPEFEIGTLASVADNIQSMSVQGLVDGTANALASAAESSVNVVKGQATSPHQDKAKDEDKEDAEEEDPQELPTDVPKSFAFSDISDSEGKLERGRSGSLEWSGSRSPSITASRSPSKNSLPAGGRAQGSMEPLMLPSQAVAATPPQERAPSRERTFSEERSPGSIVRQKSTRFADEDGSPLASTQPVPHEVRAIRSDSLLDPELVAVVRSATSSELLLASETDEEVQTVASESTTVTEKKEEEFVRKEEFKDTDPASIIYGLNHSIWRFQGRIRDLQREITMWVLLMYPQGIRSLMRIGTCFPIIEGEPWRLGMDFDVECSRHHQDFFKTLATSLTFGIPALVFLYVYRHSGDLFDLNARRAISIFSAGYKPETYMWECLIMMRTGLVIRISSEPTFVMRCLAMFVIIALFLFLNTFCRPFEAHGRFAMEKFDRISQLGIVLLILLGVMNQEEVDSVGTMLSAVVNPAGFWNIMFGLFVLSWNMYAVFRVLWAGAFMPMVNELQAIIDDGGAVSTSLRMALRFANATHGLHQVLYYKDPRTGDYVMDASELNKRERDFLLFSLQEIISACVDSEKELHTGLIEKAIMQAFQRASRAREALKNDLYFKFGLRTYHRGCLPCFEAQLRNPDVKDFQEARDGIRVTVEELHTALRDVSNEVLDHLGSLRKDVAIAESQKAELESKRKDSHHVLMWNQNESLKKLDEELDFKASLGRVGSGDTIGKTQTASSQQTQDTSLYNSDRSQYASERTPDQDHQSLMLTRMEADFKTHREEEKAAGRAAQTAEELIQQLEGLQAEEDALLAHLQREWKAVEERHYREVEQEQKATNEKPVELEMPSDPPESAEAPGAQPASGEDLEAAGGASDAAPGPDQSAEEVPSQPDVVDASGNALQEVPSKPDVVDASGNAPQEVPSKPDVVDASGNAPQEVPSQPDVVDASGNAPQDQRRPAARPKQKAAATKEQSGSSSTAV